MIRHAVAALLAFAASLTAAAGPLAGEGQFVQALRYRNSTGVTTNATAALALMKSAAQLGHPPAMFVLSNMLAAGEGAAPSPQAAQQWLLAAAARDYPEALQQLALEEKDPFKSAQLMRASAHALRHRAHGHGRGPGQ